MKSRKNRRSTHKKRISEGTTIADNRFFRPRPPRPERPERGERGDFRSDRAPQHRINGDIRARQVRIVGDNIGESRVVSIDEALRIARDLELDLLMIVENSEPPVCRVVDYQKFLYEQRRKQKEMRKSATKVEMKELRFTPNMGENDFQLKLRHAIRFFEEGAKVKADLRFMKRSILFKDLGEALLLRFAKELEEYAKVEQLPQLNEKHMVMVLAPLKTAKKKPQEKKGAAAEASNDEE